MSKKTKSIVTHEILVADKDGKYCVTEPVSIDQLYCIVADLLEKEFYRSDVLSSPDITKQFLLTKLAKREHEVFCCIFLDTRLQVIAFEEMFRGTINGASVHPREVVKRCLQHNASAVIFAHNHPSGLPEPSKADEAITTRLINALQLVEIRLLDHLVIGGSQTVSFAERG